MGRADRGDAWLLDYVMRFKPGAGLGLLARRGLGLLARRGALSGLRILLGTINLFDYRLIIFRRKLI